MLQTRIAKSQVTSHYAMCWIVMDLNPSRDKSYISSPKVQTFRRVPTDCFTVGKCLCLELNRAGVERLVNRYRLMFVSEESSRGACS